MLQLGLFVATSLLALATLCEGLELQASIDFHEGLMDSMKGKPSEVTITVTGVHQSTITLSPGPTASSTRTCCSSPTAKPSSSSVVPSSSHGTPSTFWEQSITKWPSQFATGQSRYENLGTSSTPLIRTPMSSKKIPQSTSAQVHADSLNGATVVGTPTPSTVQLDSWGATKSSLVSLPSTTPVQLASGATMPRFCLDIFVIMLLATSLLANYGILL